MAPRIGGKGKSAGKSKHDAKAKKNNPNQVKDFVKKKRKLGKKVPVADHTQRASLSIVRCI